MVEIYKGTIGCTVTRQALSIRHQGDIVRVFFLLESLRGNGTKLFTSLKHNRFHSSRDSVALSWLSSYGADSGRSSGSRRLSKYGCSRASSAVNLSSPSRTSIFSSRSIPFELALGNNVEKSFLG